MLDLVKFGIHVRIAAITATIDLHFLKEISHIWATDVLNAASCCFTVVLTLDTQHVLISLQIRIIINAILNTRHDP